MEGLRNALTIFLQELTQSQQDVRVSLVVYSTSSQKLVPLTADLGLIQSTFAPIEPFGFTAIGEGLTDGLDSMLNDPGRRPFAERAILLMTDGTETIEVEIVVDFVQTSAALGFSLGVPGCEVAAS